MFQYNYARYTSRGGSKPFFAGFQPPKTILTIRPALHPQESVSFSRVLSYQLKHKSNFKPKTSQCGTHALCTLTHLKRPNKQQVKTNGLSREYPRKHSRLLYVNANSKININIADPCTYVNYNQKVNSLF